MLLASLRTTLWIALMTTALACSKTTQEPVRWVATWGAAQQLTETTNLPPAPGLSGNTLRQVVSLSIGGSRWQLHLSNAFGEAPVEALSVHLAKSAGGSAIESGTELGLTFGGTPSVTIPAGASAVSDPFEAPFDALTTLAVSIHFGSMPVSVTGHPGSRTTSYLQPGDAVSAVSLPSAQNVEHWYFLSGIEVASTRGRAVVTLGDSITDGRGSTTNGNNRWPDNLARRLQASAATANVAVVNQGIGGNAVLQGGLGPTAVARFERDVLGQSGVRWLIVLEGVNDIGNSRSASVAADLIAAYENFIDKAHAHEILVYGVPILPFAGSSYDSVEHEAARQSVNDWIRNSGRFDAVIDLDLAVRDPESPNRLLAAYDSGDHLHLNVAGYQRMADAIDLSLFEK